MLEAFDELSFRFSLLRLKLMIESGQQTFWGCRWEQKNLFLSVPLKRRFYWIISGLFAACLPACAAVLPGCQCCRAANAANAAAIQAWEARDNCFIVSRLSTWVSSTIKIWMSYFPVQCRVSGRNQSEVFPCNWTGCEIKWRMPGHPAIQEKRWKNVTGRLLTQPTRKIVITWLQLFLIGMSLLVWPMVHTSNPATADKSGEKVQDKFNNLKALLRVEN